MPLQIWRSHRTFDERAALIVGVVVMAIVVELLGGVIFDFDVTTGYRNVFRKLDEMVAETEGLRG